VSKRECFTRFDKVHYWLSRTRDLIANAETYSYPAFRESFRELRRKSRRDERCRQSITTSGRQFL
jgi:hypothetical protein